MSQPQPKPKPRDRILFRLFKGFIYGNIFGLIFGTAIYLLATAVDVISGGLPISPTTFMALIYSASVVTGTAVEYSEWLETAE